MRHVGLQSQGAIAIVAVGCMAALASAASFVVLREIRTAFIAHVAQGLRLNFIIANPALLWMSTVLVTCVSAVTAYVVANAVAAGAAVLLGALAPRLVLRRMVHLRRKRFLYQLPDALLALAASMRAGASFNRGLELVATQQPAPLAQEFTILIAEQRVGRALADSLRDLCARIPAEEIELLATAINVSRKVGGNLADTLESLARTLQEKAHMEGKIDALTSMGRAQGWVVGLLPLFIGLALFQQQPDRMQLLFTQWYGWVVLAVIAAMMALAAWMIRKIVRIDV